jgi:hypothetical protein
MGVLDRLIDSGEYEMELVGLLTGDIGGLP